MSYADLEAIDPDYYKSLRQTLDLPLEALGMEDRCVRAPL